MKELTAALLVSSTMASAANAADLLETAVAAGNFNTFATALTNKDGVVHVIYSVVPLN